ncbi:MAG: protease complex subunit PrcB family protein [Dethiobacter sp.]|nr:protease complex subunit PrcB family protein [Dethiobacter sp.]
MLKKAFPLLLLVFLLIALAGCNSRQNSIPDTGLPGDGTNHPPAQTAETAEIDAWVERSLPLFLAQSRELAGTQYLLVTYGLQNDGYAVEITAVDVEAERVKVTVQFTAPAQGQQGDGTVEYPYALREIPATGLPVVFVAQGAEEYLPRLQGLDYLPPIAAQSSGIKIFSPAPAEVVERSMTVRGVGNVFEGNIQYKLLAENETVLVSGFATAAMGDWQLFSIDIVIDEAVAVEGPILLRLYTYSAKDGSVQDLIEIPLTLMLKA